METTLQILFFASAFLVSAIRIFKCRHGIMRAFKKGKLFYPLVCAGFSLAFTLLFLCYGMTQKYEALAYLSISAIVVGEIVYITHLILDARRGNVMALLFLAANISSIAKVSHACWQCGDIINGILDSNCLNKISIGIMYIFFYVCEEIIKIGNSTRAPKPKKQSSNEDTDKVVNLNGNN